MVRCDRRSQAHRHHPPRATGVGDLQQEQAPHRARPPAQLRHDRPRQTPPPRLRSHGARPGRAAARPDPSLRRATDHLDRQAQADSSHSEPAPTAAQITSPGTVSVLTYRDYFDEYRGRPEHKALGPDGQRCHAWTRGILQPPIITATQLVPHWQGNRHRRKPASPDPSQPTSPEITYAPPTCPICGKPLDGKRVYCSDACRKKAARASILWSLTRVRACAGATGVRARWVPEMPF